MSEPRHVYRSEHEAQLDCQWWQQILRLQDWDVKVRIVRSREMRYPDAEGECRINADLKRVVILLLDPQDYDDEWPQDHEATLVHELIHIHMVPLKIDPESPENTALEQAIEMLALALVGLRRRTAGK